jgi:hypothetical protein
MMIGLIPFIKNDYYLSIVYIVIILISFLIKKERNDVKVFILGLIIMTISEIIFTSTGVEVFIRNSLFGLMPLWLPLLWGYVFVVIKRVIKILEL